jgi:hypothetical protein
MGTRYVLHFDNDEFMKSVNEAKWNIYAVALQDLTFFTFSYLKVNFNFQEIGKSKEIFLKILDDETSNNMPLDIIDKTKKVLKKGFKQLIGINIIQTFLLIQVLYHCMNGHR